jgi:hypothetical protein
MRATQKLSLSGFALASVLLLLLAGTAQAATPPVQLGTTASFGVVGGSTITNTGPTVINGDLGLHPGTAVTGFPPGTVNGAMHLTDAVALQAKTDLVTGYDDAAGRPLTATSPPDIGGQVLTSGVYRTGGVPALGLTGNLSLDAQGDPSAVFIFQIQSTLTTATDSSITLLNGAQSCNIFWQVGSSAPLGTRTAFKGNVLALTSISVEDAVTVDGRLLARNGAVTLINDTINRSTCAGATGGTTGGGGTDTGTRSPYATDKTGPRVYVGGIPTSTTRNFTTRVGATDTSGLAFVHVYLDGRLVSSTRTAVAVVIKARGLRAGVHVITVVTRDRAGNQTVVRRRFTRASVTHVQPHFTG